jgi:hypothetical protein
MDNNEMLKDLREKRSPDGSLFLTAHYAEQVLRWIEITEGILKRQAHRITELENEKQIAIRKHSEIEG